MAEPLLQQSLQPLDGQAGPARPITDQRARALVRGALSRVIAGESETWTRPIPPARRFARVALVAGGLLVGGAAVAGLAYTGLGLGWKAAAPATPIATRAMANEPKGDPAPPAPPSASTATATDAEVTTTAAATSSEHATAIHLPSGRKLTSPRSHALLRASSEVIAPANDKRADDLLSRANQLRGERQWHEAAAAYQAVIAGSSESHAAYVAMLARAELLLDHLDRPAEALRLFQRALAEPSGVLTEEARYGLAACYRALGDVENERRALNAFLAAHPHSLMRSSAAARLGELH